MVPGCQPPQLQSTLSPMLKRSSTAPLSLRLSSILQEGGGPVTPGWHAQVQASQAAASRFLGHLLLPLLARATAGGAGCSARAAVLRGRLMLAWW